MTEHEVLSCGFSHHFQPFHIAYTEQLQIYLVRLQTQGVSHIHINGTMAPVTAGDLLLLKPGDPYQLDVGGDLAADDPQSSDYFLMCRGAWVDEWWAKHSRPKLHRIDLDEKLLSIWRLLVLQHRTMNADNRELSGYLMRSLLLTIDQVLSAPTAARGKSFVATRMVRYIEEHATTPFRLEDVAEVANLSVSRAVHLFKEMFGKTIIQYAHEVRLSIAKERMLYTNMTLEQIAVTCGFGSYTHFFRVFRKHFGMTPAEYRDTMR